MVPLSSPVRASAAAPFSKLSRTSRQKFDQVLALGSRSALNGGGLLARERFGAGGQGAAGTGWLTGRESGPRVEVSKGNKVLSAPSVRRACPRSGKGESLVSW